MDFSKEIKTMIEKAVKQAIDDLAIKEQIRDYISSAITKKEIVNKTDSLIDSYFRSAMNCINVEQYIKGEIDKLVTTAVKKEIDDVTRSCYSGWNGRERIKQALDMALKREFDGKYKVGISIEQIEKGGEG